MTVSVIFTACNQGQYVRQTVAEARRSLASVPHEIIVVDDQSVDKCCHGIDPDVLIMRTDYRKGVSACRRMGAQAARGDVLLFSDPHCVYPENTLARLAELARSNWAVIQPPTNRKPGSSRIAWGGALYKGDRGLMNGRAPKGHRGVSLINTIYCVRKAVYDSFGGWPYLPGCWGYSEQAMSLMCWFSGVPIIVADVPVCSHLNTHVERQLPFKCTETERAINGHIVHAAFFPETWREQFRGDLLQRFRNEKQCNQALTETPFKRLVKQVESRRVRREGDFYEMMLHKTGENGSDVSGSIIDQQRERSLAMGSRIYIPRLRRSFEWFVKVIPGCISGRSVLDVGARLGHSLSLLSDMGARIAEGVELLPEVAEAARDRGADVRCADMRKLPYPDGMWHVVTSLHTLEHLTDPVVGLREMTRVLLPGGWLLVVVPKEIEPRPEYAHNCCFADRNALKAAIRAVPELIPETMKTTVKKYAKGEYEIRLAVKKRRK